MFDESRKNRMRMSSPKRPRRTKSTCASSPSDSAKVIRNIETTKQRLEQLAEKYKGINANADKYVEHPPVPDKNLSIV